MKILKYYTLLTLGLVSYILFSSYAIENFEKYVNYGNKDLIKFNHSVHIKSLDIKCVSCHKKVPESNKSEDALTPSKPACANCHDVKDKKECNFCHYDNVYKKLIPTSKELNFSHKVHLTLGKTCDDCHKNMKDYKYSDDNPNKYPPMELCYGCHNQESEVIKKSSGECEVCHTNLINLKPVNHLSSNFLNEHKWVFENSDEKNNCMMCHSDNFCMVCHSAGNYRGENKKNNFYAPYYTKNSGNRIDRAELQKLNTIHNLNYLYTHGIDAKQKSFECKTCHNPTEFCSACHSNNGNILTGILPRSHLSPNFTTFGVNTGGGLHSELARRDIEFCQSCHDASGVDPVCIRCHFDNDGFKGTNPKTHEKNFLNDEKGIWHETNGAICFSCHTDLNAKPNGRKGIGFCGYCHK
ncbi:MAG: cytochrome C [Ignavibacteria bacterium]|nr:cytochrome C [Ignavibacteria bacterium]